MVAPIIACDNTRKYEHLNVFMDSIINITVIKSSINDLDVKYWEKQGASISTLRLAIGQHQHFENIKG